MNDGGWNLTQHCCATCLGRVVERSGIYRCATCGREAREVRDVCCCGLKRADGQSLGFRCEVNPDKSPRMPAEIVAMFAGATPGDGARAGA